MPRRHEQGAIRPPAGGQGYPAVPGTTADYRYARYPRAAFTHQNDDRDPQIRSTVLVRAGELIAKLGRGSTRRDDAGATLLDRPDVVRSLIA